MIITTERVGDTERQKFTLEEFTAEGTRLFGPNGLDWAFQCPRCGTVATGRDFPPEARKSVGQECVGRHVENVDCNWVAYGLIRGPWEVVMADGHSAFSFPFAPVKGDPTEETAQEIPGEDTGP